MKELSLHILDIAENSIRANATEIYIEVDEDIDNNIFSFEIKDNGKGMDKEFVESVKDPFKTSRTTRRVGLGIPLLEAACKRCNGDVKITSSLNKGTQIKAWMDYDHIDRAPLGDIVSTITNLILANPDIDFIYCHKYNDKSFELDTKEIKNVLDGVPINDLGIINWIKNYIKDEMTEIKQ